MSDNKQEDAGSSGKKEKENEVENIELEEKGKGEKEELLSEGEESDGKRSPKHKSIEESPMSKAFFLSKYVTFW